MRERIYLTLPPDLIEQSREKATEEQTSVSRIVEKALEKEIPSPIRPLRRPDLSKITDEDREKFWRTVDVKGPDECWNRLVQQPGNRHTIAVIRGFSAGAHRWAYLLTHGEAGDYHILHSCNNKRCCNPAHLRAGTQKENMADRSQDYRSRGERFAGRPNRGRVTITVNVEPETLTALRVLAAQQGTTQGDIVDALLEKYEKRHAEQKEKAMLTDTPSFDAAARRLSEMADLGILSPNEYLYLRDNDYGAGEEHWNWIATCDIEEFKEWLAPQNIGVDADDPRYIDEA